MALTCPEALLTVLRRHAEAGYPNEVVGVLAGRRPRGGEDGVVARVQPLVNERSDSAANRYAVSALTLARTEQALEADGVEILGYYHSHPDHPSRYSEFDRDHALPNMSYVIVSVKGGESTTLQSWRLRDDRSAMDEELVTPIPEPQE